MRNKCLIFLMAVLFLPAVNFAQNGTIRGTILDAITAEPLIGVKVLIEGTTSGDITDLEGAFDISAPAGTCSIKISFLSYETITITEVQVKSGEITHIGNIPMKEATTTLGEVTVSVTKITDSDNSITKMRQNSTNTIDAIGQETWKRNGDGDAVGAIQRVPGISVAGGRYVYVRGLGDRYNKTLLNGMDIPGLDPDRNTLQMDIFPTSVISNMVIYKSLSADLPADFAGGIIDIGLKAFPEKSQGSVVFSFGYNPNYHFNSNYVTYQGSKTDFLGFDDGSRDIPAVTNIPFFSQAVGNPDGEDGLRYREILGSFNPTLAAMRQTSFMDYSVGTNYGNQIKLKKFTLGYNFVITYKNSTEYFEDAEYGRYGLSGNSAIAEMEIRERQVGDFGVNNVLLTGMAGFAIKTEKFRFRFNALHLQNGESKAGVFDYYNADQGAVFQGFQHNLEYSQRSLTNLFIEGIHSFENTDWGLTWKIAPTLSTIYDPDIRFTRYEDRDSVYTISTESGFPERIWRELNEKNLNGQVHISKKFTVFDEESEIKFGGAYTYKQRDFVVRTFALNVRNMDLTGDPNELFAPENLWPYNGDPTTGTTFEANFVPVNPNRFSATVSNIAAYASTEIKFSKRFRTVAGVRVENYTQRYTGQDQLGTNVLDNDKVLDNLGIFPSLNLVYAVTEKQNLRFSYGKTIARPSFKELSYAEIYDPITGRTFIGGLFRDADDASGTVYWDGNLVSTDIHNFDLRWEFYNKPGQSISAGVFYKKFFNPIEIVQFSAQAGSFQPRNVGDGEVLGGEIEIKQSLGFLSEKLNALTLSANVTYTLSRIKLSETEYQSRINNAREGQDVGLYRDMAGQSPYLINAGLYYQGQADSGFWNGFELGILYNVQGKTLEYVGIVDRPDIYTNPFHSLNLNIMKTFGSEGQYQLGFKAENLLNDSKESVFSSYNATDMRFSRLNPGRTFILRFSYSF